MTEKTDKWEAEYQKIINKWKDPEFDFEWHDTMIDYTKNLIIETKQFISSLLEQEKQKMLEEMEKIIPHKYPMNNHLGYNNGYNDCVDEINLNIKELYSKQ